MCKYFALVVLLVSQSAARADSTPLARLWEHEFKGQHPQGLALDGEGRPYLYVTLKSGGLAVLKLGAAPQEVARIAIGQFAQLDVMHLTQRGDRLYLALGDHFAAQGAKAGLAIVSVANPIEPKVLGVWTSPQPMAGAAVVVVDEKHAYLGAMTEGVMIFDITKPEQIRHLTTFRPDVDFPRKNPNRVQHPNARGFSLRDNRLYVAYDAGGIRVLDVTNRAKPKEIGRYVNAGMAQKQQAYNNLVLDGDRLYAAIDYAGLEILDVKQPAAIRQLGWWNPWKAETLQNLWLNSPGHTNQLALDRKKQLVYLSAGDSELQVVDVSKPERPQLVAHYGDVKNDRGTWGMALGADAVYLTYVTAVVPFRSTWAGVVTVKRK